ncbi:MAG: glucans biosynthesis glucosyltransferase MdoH [Candidatus Binatia bacterium]
MSTRYVVSGWRKAALARRTLLIFLVSLQTCAGVYSIIKTLPYQGQARFELGLIVLFAVLFSWISLGFWTALAGFILRWRRQDRFDLAESPSGAFAGESALTTRTAILMPIYNEDVKPAFAGVRATYASLRKTGQLQSFDFFILSDTNDPNKWIEEEMAWTELCQAAEGYDRIYYRHRRQNIRRKSGNIADFCRRWGANYDYMIVLDADSVMEGDAIVRLVRMMDHRPRAGLIQTVSLAVNQSSLFGRIQQFANQVYTPVFAAGMHFWSLGESPYWGHNAIVRVAPFMEHCALPRLSGSGPLGGEILSHDFVEAALLGRAGWEVWLAYGLSGSYEETPPTLYDELKRDQRWCQGNLQHARLLPARGIRPGHRAVFLTGILTYVSALLWLVFLCLTTAELALQSLFEPDYFSNGPSLFPIWPRWHPEVAVALLGTTFFMLFVPKFLALALILKNGEQKSFGGFGPLCASVVIEALISAILAPIRMMFHSRFVLTTFMGRSIRWIAQRRGEGQIGFVDAVHQQGWVTVIAIAWAAGVYWVNPLALWLFAPVFVGSILAIPLTVYSSRRSLGLASRNCKLFLIPQELHRGEGIVRHKQALLDQAEERLHMSGPTPEAFERAIFEPYTNTVHVALLGKRRPRASSQSMQLQRKLLSDGIDSLTSAEKKRLLLNGSALAELHLKVWDLDPIVQGPSKPGSTSNRPE